MNRSFVTSTITLPLILVLFLFVGLFTPGCGAKETPTPTPTKTPTIAPLVTPTPALQEEPTATPSPTSEPTKESPTETPTPTTQPTNTVEPLPELVAMNANINPLTGLKVDQANLDRRPLAIKIPNYPIEARPQSGISLADVVVEHEAEAYLTRFTAVFLGNDASLVGPIRSMRLIESELISIFKSVLVASGGHPAVKVRVVEGKSWAEGYKRIVCPEDPFLGDGGTMQRIADKKPQYELTMYNDTKSLWNLAAERDVNQQQDFYEMFTFSQEPPSGGSEATTIKIVYKPAASEVEYQYDAESETYKRFDLGQPTMDELTGKQVAPSNVVVIYVNHVDTDIAADTHDPNYTWYSISIQLWGQGKAKLMRDGQVYDCTWVREHPQGENDRLVFFDDKGRQIPFHPGATWIQLVRLDGNVAIEANSE